MISDLSMKRAAIHFLAAAFVAVVISGGHSACGGIEGRELVVTLRLPLQATSEQGRQAAEAQIAQAAAFGADGVAVEVQAVSGETAALIRHLAGLRERRGIKLWVAVLLPRGRALDVAREAASLPVEGLALCFAPPKGEPIDPAKREALLALKRQGDERGETIRQVKRQLGPQKKLALCTALSEIAPETARAEYVPLGDLIRDQVVDVVALGEAERVNLHRLRLLRNVPLRAGCFLNSIAIEEKRRAGQLSRTVLEAIQNDTCELIWLWDFPLLMAAQVVPAAVEGLKESHKRRAALEAALARGELVLDQQVSEKNCNDQASLHGVAQSFVPSRDGNCPLVQVYLAIRGSRGPLPPPLNVEIRRDEKGKPGTDVLARTTIPAAEFGLEPDYRWGSAQWEPPVPLKKGQTYWIYLTNHRHPEGNYVWRIVKDGASPRGQAWSKLYDYTKHCWVFRVYLKKEPSP